MSECDPIRIRFYLCGESDSADHRVEDADFEVNSDLESDIEQWLDDFNTDNETDYEIDDRDVLEFDDDYPHPFDFTDLNEYGALVEKIVEYGPAYKARWEDRGDFDWDDEYCGCWESEEEYCQQLYEDCYEIPDHLQGYIDWEKLTRDIMMDHDSYYVGGEYHIFRA